MFRAFRAVPLIALVIALYNITVIGMFMPLDWVVFSMSLVSGAVWEMNLGDALVAFGIVLLFFEVLNAGSARAATLVNHTLSLGVFVFALVEFLLVPWCGTSTFFLLMLLALADVVSGYAVTIMVARRDVAFGP
ncbi:MAG: hypothetical protein AAF321_00170 [Pseudomonadota bacterium]